MTDATFVTGDSGLLGKGVKIHPTDAEVIESAKTGEGLITVTPEMLDDLANAARETWDEFSSLAATITPEQAAFVRKLRVDDGWSWRGVAQECYNAWNGDWQPPSNQIMGMALCEAAAKHFSEDYMQEPWN